MIYRNLSIKLRRFGRDSDGNVAVEFALVAPLFILMALGLADYALAARERSTLDAAARAGLQVLLDNPANISVATALASTLAPAATASATLTCTCSDGTVVDCTAGTCAIGAPRRVVAVSVTESYSLLVSWPGFTNPQQLAATAVGRIR